MNAAQTSDATDPILAEVQRFYESHHAGIERSRLRHRYFYRYLERIFRLRVPEGLRALDLGCGTGDLLASLRPGYGVGIVLSGPAIRAARERPGPHGGQESSKSGLRFIQGGAADEAGLASAGGPFDGVLLVNVVTHLTDVQQTLERLHAVVHPRTRLLIYSYSRLWQPLLRVAERFGLKYRQPPESWLPPDEIKNML